MKDFIDTVLERARRDPEFLRELLAELKRDEALDELAAQAQELGMGYDTEDGEQHPDH